MSTSGVIKNGRSLLHPAAPCSNGPAARSPTVYDFLVKSNAENQQRPPTPSVTPAPPKKRSREQSSAAFVEGRQGQRLTKHADAILKCVYYNYLFAQNDRRLTRAQEDWLSEKAGVTIGQLRTRFVNSRQRYRNMSHAYDGALTPQDWCEFRSLKPRMPRPPVVPTPQLLQPHPRPATPLDRLCYADTFQLGVQTSIHPERIPGVLRELSRLGPGDEFAKLVFKEHEASFGRPGQPYGLPEREQAYAIMTKLLEELRSVLIADVNVNKTSTTC